MNTGKTAVVTGAARGIGAAVAKRLCADGHSVALLDLDEAAVQETARRLELQGARAFAFACDAADKKSVEAVFSAVAAQLGQIDILVNNAGITRDAMFHKMTEEQWEQVLNVNLKSVFYCCQAVIEGMRARKYGKIVNYASVSAFGNMGQTNYGASKAAIIGFTKCLAKENARNNITVNAIAPSYVNTEMLRAVPQQVLEKFLAAIPMGRLGEPEELAGVTSFLCGGDSSFVTGECLVVSGGSYM